MNRLSIRLRLTLLVTTVFVLALIAAGSLARQRLETTLVDTARSNANATLEDSFLSVPEVSSESVNGTSTTVQGVTRFVFTDLEGVELGQDEFANLVNEATATELAELGFFFGTDDMIIDEMLILDPEGNLVPFETGFAETIAVPQLIVPVGEPDNADTDDAIVVTQRVTIGDEELAISVSTPRQPLDESLRAFTYLGLVMIPLLGAGVALATWITTSRVLRPVEDIRRQVEQTDSDRLSAHVPRSGNGDEVDRLAGTMNDMLDRLRVASDRQRQFVSDASHELRSPITATLATLETTNASDAAERWPEIETTLAAEQQKLARLVDDLLLLATVDETHESPLISAVDLDELVIAEAGRPHAVSVSAHVIKPQRVSGTTRLLARCLANLVENAAHHAATHVDVTVTTTPDGFPLVRIDDDGAGIPEDRLEDIFERFTRVDDARNRREGGAGLGLSIARGIAHQHGATLTASNLAKGGARFELVFGEQPTTDR